MVEDGAYFNSNSSCGDLNGDSFVDWYIIRVYAAVADSKFVSVYWGGPNADTTADLSFWIEWDEGLSIIEPFFGSHGNRFDFNGDGFDDLGFSYNLPTSPFNSIFRALFGGNPMDLEYDWIAHGFDGPPYIPAVTPQSFGYVNGDGTSDFVTQAAGNAYFYFGGSQPDTLPGRFEDVPASNSTLTADMNGDGRADLICPRWPGGQVYLGGDEMTNASDFTLNFGCGDGPHYVSNAGDVNHDGFEDVVILDNSCGRLAVYLGYFWINTDPVFSLETISDPFDLNAVSCADGVGDVNGDGIEDMAIGATSNEAGAVPGRVVILTGDSTLRIPATERPLLARRIRVFQFIRTRSIFQQQSNWMSLGVLASRACCLQCYRTKCLFGKTFL